MLELPVSSAAGSEVVVLEELVDEALELVELATIVCITLSEKKNNYFLRYKLVVYFSYAQLWRPVCL